MSWLGLRLRATNSISDDVAKIMPYCEGVPTHFMTFCMITRSVADARIFGSRNPARCSLASTGGQYDQRPHSLGMDGNIVYVFMIAYWLRQRLSLASTVDEVFPRIHPPKAFYCLPTSSTLPIRPRNEGERSVARCDCHRRLSHQPKSHKRCRCPLGTTWIAIGRELRYASVAGRSRGHSRLYSQALRRSRACVHRD